LGRGQSHQGSLNSDSKGEYFPQGGKDFIETAGTCILVLEKTTSLLKGRGNAIEALKGRGGITRDVERQTSLRNPGPRWELVKVQGSITTTAEKP